MRTYFDKHLKNEQLFKKYPAFTVHRKGYHPARTRRKLLGDSEFVPGRVVPFLFKPFDDRWLYWEPLHKLLNRPRPELMGYYIRSDPSGFKPVNGQLAIVASQTPRRVGAARPCVTSAVPGFHAVDPDAKVLPRIRPPGGLEGFGGGEEEDYITNILPDWLEAARAAGVEGDPVAVGDVIFYSLIAIMNARAWIEAIGTDNHDFPGVPLPSNPELLHRAAEVGKQLAYLFDPFSAVDGVTTGRIKPVLGRVAVPDRPRSRTLISGSTKRGGCYVEEGGGSILWGDELGWRNVPLEVWEFSVGGFQVLPKWLGYRHHQRDGYTLSDLDFEAVTHICRRIAAVLLLEPECERLYQAALASPLETQQVEADPRRPRLYSPSEGRGPARRVADKRLEFGPESS